MNILLAFIAFDIIIIAHELGHFIAGKLCGIKILEFSLFIGPRIFGFKRGDTEYSLRLIPALAYVRFEGEEESSDSKTAFSNQPVYKRFLAVAAGPFASLLLAVLLFIISYSISGYGTTEIDRIFTDSPAYQAGLQQGDEIIRYNDRRVYQPMDIALFMYEAKGKSVPVVVKRDGQKLEKTVTPEIVPENRYILGYSPSVPYGSDSNTVDTVSPGSPAEKAGLQKGDRIIAVNGEHVATKQQISNYLSESKDKPLQLTVRREDKELLLDQVTPMQDKNPQQYVLGFGYKVEKGNALQIVSKSLVDTYATTRTGVYSIVWLVTGKVPANQMAGPVGIVSTISTVVEQSPSAKDILINLLNLCGWITIGLGVSNLLPIPPTDGFKLVLYGIEAIRRKPLPVEKEASISMVGFAILLGLFVLLTYNDIMNIVRTMTGG